MTNSHLGGNPASLVLHDQEGTAFSFVPVRLLRDGTDVFLLAEREGEGTLHVLRREGDAVGLVRDRATLRRVAARLEVLRRAMEGELIEGAGEPPALLGVIHRGEVEGHAYILAADLADPTIIVAFETKGGVLSLADDALVTAIRERWEETALPWEAAAPNLEAATLGLHGERVLVTTPAGEQAFEAAGRFFFEGRDLLFLRPADAPSAAAHPVEVRPGGRLEPVRDEPFLVRLDSHLEAYRR